MMRRPTATDTDEFSAEVTRGQRKGRHFVARHYEWVQLHGKSVLAPGIVQCEEPRAFRRGPIRHGNGRHMSRVSDGLDDFLEYRQERRWAAATVQSDDQCSAVGQLLAGRFEVVAVRSPRHDAGEIDDCRQSRTLNHLERYARLGEPVERLRNYEFGAAF